MELHYYVSCFRSHSMKLIAIIFYGLCFSALGRQGFGPTEQEWGYVTVREGAHMFWWLHYTAATPNPTEKPLIVWLQGGPGASSTQYGNFEELGPWDTDLNPRNTTWVNHANVMFVDNPVGTGFSYVDSDEFTTTNQQIGLDFVALMQGFYEDFPQFEDVPLYIFSESYGGKMAAEIAYSLYQAIQDGSIKSNFKGVGLGDSSVSPIDSCIMYAPFLYNLGFLDTQQYQKLNEEALRLKGFIDNGDWETATNAAGNLSGSIERYAPNVDFYNVLTVVRSVENRKANQKSEGFIKSALGDEKEFMNGKVKPALNLSSDWGAQSDWVPYYLHDDIMKPVTGIVESLLNETDIIVAVYSGQLDLIVDTPGTLNWVDKLHFKDSDIWSGTEKTSFVVNNIYEGFEKKAGYLEFYWVLRSGHMVPIDNPNAMLHILEQVTDNFKV